MRWSGDTGFTDYSGRVGEGLVWLVRLFLHEDGAVFGGVFVREWYFYFLFLQKRSPDRQVHLRYLSVYPVQIRIHCRLLQQNRTPFRCDLASTAKTNLSLPQLRHSNRPQFLICQLHRLVQLQLIDVLLGEFGRMAAALNNGQVYLLSFLVYRLQLGQVCVHEMMEELYCHFLSECQFIFKWFAAVKFSRAFFYMKGFWDRASPLRMYVYWCFFD